MKNSIKYDIFIKGVEIDLICLSSEIAIQTNWYNWFNDEDLTKGMQKHYYPNTKETQLFFFKNEIEENKSKLQVGILHKEDNVMIGTLSLNGIDYQNQNCEISGFIGEVKYQTLKYFVEANKLLVKHAFEQLNMNKIHGGSLSEDVCLIFTRILKFKNEGVLKKLIYKNGKFNDVFLIGLLREEYFVQINKSK